MSILIGILGSELDSNWKEVNKIKEFSNIVIERTYLHTWENQCIKTLRRSISIVLSALFKPHEHTF